MTKSDILGVLWAFCLFFGIIRQFLASFGAKRIGVLDRLELKARNELLILKREINEGKLNSSINSLSRHTKVRVF